MVSRGSHASFAHGQPPLGLRARLSIGRPQGTLLRRLVLSSHLSPAQAHRVTSSSSSSIHWPISLRSEDHLAPVADLLVARVQDQVAVARFKTSALLRRPPPPLNRGCHAHEAADSAGATWICCAAQDVPVETGAAFWGGTGDPGRRPRSGPVQKGAVVAGPQVLVDEREQLLRRHLRILAGRLRGRGPLRPDHPLGLDSSRARPELLAQLDPEGEATRACPFSA